MGWKACPHDAVRLVRRADGGIEDSRARAELSQEAKEMKNFEILLPNSTLICAESGTPEWIRTTDLLLRRQNIHGYSHVFSAINDTNRIVKAEHSTLITHVLRHNFAEAA